MTSYRDPRRIFWIGLSIMFILIGVAAVLGVVFNPHNFTVNGINWLGIASGIMLASKNDEGLRILGERVRDYLTNIVGSQIILKPFFREDFLKMLAKSQKVMNFYVNATQPTEKLLEDSGLADSAVFSYSPEEGYSFSITLNGKPSFPKMIVSRIIDAVIENKEDIGKAYITLEDEIRYNILEKTFDSYVADIEREGTRINYSQLQGETRRLFFQHKEDLLSRIPDVDISRRIKQKRLDSL
jgi:hypothetical protein